MCWMGANAFALRPQRMERFGAVDKLRAALEASGCLF